MANLVTGAMGSLIPKLGELLKEEYSLQTGVKERISCLSNELEHAQAALCKVAEVPWDQLDKQVQIWARKVREASYDMEDVLDTFLVRVKGPDESTEEKKSLRKYLKEMTKFFKKSKARRKISGDVKNIVAHLQEVTEQFRRYKVDDIVARPDTASTVDPRLAAMYTQVKKLVGIDKSSGELMSMLQKPQQGDVSGTKMKVVSIVGVGGLGKTTLAKVVFDKIKGDFDCTAFVPVGRNPDLKKILKDILIDLDQAKYIHFSTAALDERQLINELRMFLHENKRYLIIIDDIWEKTAWETIKLAIADDKNCGGRIIITTRILEVATKAHEVYNLPALPYETSRELLFARIYGDERTTHVDSQPDETSDKFIWKCGGIPLAIITMASLLVGKPRDKWSELYNTIDFGSKDNEEAENTMRIVSFSYYDLPSHLRTCLLYLSAFPEDSIIKKDSLVWKWVAEGFIQENVALTLFESGEGYFNDLINRSMIQAVESEDDDIIIGCRVHDMVLDFICSMSREENFVTILDNNQDTLLQSNASRQSNARRLAYHKRTIGHCHRSNGSEIPKLRSFIGLGCVIEKWAPLFSFTVLRVLAIEDCKSRDGSHTPVQVGDLRHLLHLRYLSLCGTSIDRIPEEIGALRFLQTLNLWGTHIPELPSSSRFLKRLLCLKISLADNLKVFPLEGMTSLEELAIWTHGPDSSKQVVKELGSLTEVRVIYVRICTDEESQRDLVESLRHLDKLQTLYIDLYFFPGRRSLEATELELPRHLRHLVVRYIELCKLPSCINPWCLPNLSHLDLWLQHVDEQDLKNLGGLPELRFLRLYLWRSSTTVDQVPSSATITWSINDADGGYFPKLRCCKLPYSMILFVANKEEKHSVSFHIWNGLQDITMPSVSDDENNGSICICSESSAAALSSLFMPSLQVLHLGLQVPTESHPDCCDNLGWEYLSSLREIEVELFGKNHDLKDKVEAALRRTAQVHPNRPVLCIEHEYPKSTEQEAGA